MKDTAFRMRSSGGFKNQLKVESIGLGGQLQGEGEVRQDDFHVSSLCNREHSGFNMQDKICRKGARPIYILSGSYTL